MHLHSLTQSQHMEMDINTSTKNSALHRHSPKQPHNHVAYCLLEGYYQQELDCKQTPFWHHSRRQKTVRVFLPILSAFLLSPGAVFDLVCWIYLSACLAVCPLCLI